MVMERRKEGTEQAGGCSFDWILDFINSAGFCAQPPSEFISGKLCPSSRKKERKKVILAEGRRWNEFSMNGFYFCKKKCLRDESTRLVLSFCEIYRSKTNTLPLSSLFHDFATSTASDN